MESKTNRHKKIDWKQKWADVQFLQKPDCIGRAAVKCWGTHGRSKALASTRSGEGLSIARGVVSYFLDPQTYICPFNNKGAPTSQFDIFSVDKRDIINSPPNK